VHAARRAPTDFLATRVRNAAPSPTLAVSEKARQLKAQGRDVIDLGGGDPDFITPEHIRNAAAAAMHAGDTHYVASSGTPALRNAIAKKLKDDNDLTYDPSEIIVTTGGKQALFEASMALVEPGVDVLILEPAWVSYDPMVTLAGGNVIHVGLDPDSNWTVTRDVLESHVTPASRVLFMNSPCNPTGRVLSQDEHQAIADFAVEHDLIVFTDEMYEKIIYDGRRHFSLASWPGLWDRTITFNGFSKAYAMTGWRLGFMAGPKVFMNEIAKVQSHSITHATSFAMAGAVAALNGPQESIREMVQAWDRRRRLVANGLNSIKGIDYIPAEGAFYAFPDIRGTGMSSMEFSDLALTEAEIAVVPGNAFGDSGEGFIRLSFATSDEMLGKTIERLSGWLGKKRG
jgi:aspartate aminotransferase